MEIRTHQIHVGNNQYLVHGTDTKSLIEIAEIIGLKYDKIEPTPIPATNGIVEVWAIGKLKDHLESVNS